LKNMAAQRTIMDRTRPPAGDPNAAGGRVSTVPGSVASQSQFGLVAETKMSDSRGSTPPVGPSDQPTAFVERDLNGHRWRIVTDYLDRIESRQVDWFGLCPSATAELAKRNRHRDVWRVRSGEDDYFAKLYHPTGLAARLKFLFRGPTALQEWAVGQYAATHGIATVMPVATAWSGDRWQPGSSLLVTKTVPDSQPLSDYWLEIRHDRWQANLLADSLARLIARAHQCGFQHGDMHPGNILVRPQGRRCEAFFVDLHRVRIGHPVQPDRAVANLAQLNQWFRRHATRPQRLRFLGRYFEYRDQFAQASPMARNWGIDVRRLVADLAAQADRHANKLWAKRDRRTLRDGRYFARVRPAPGWRGHALLLSKHPPSTTGGKTLSFTRQQWQEWLRDPQAFVDPSKQELLKDSHSATICRATLGDGAARLQVVAKRPLARNAWKKLGQVFGRSRNRRNWRVANMLGNRDLPVALPLLVVERYVAGLFRTDSLALIEYIEGAVDLETFLTREIAALPTRRQRAVKDTLIQSVVRLLKTFHDRGFVHRDMKAPNLMVKWPAPYQREPLLVFIDMDGIFHRRRCGESQRLRAVVRLCASLVDSPACTSSDRLRFLKGYLTGPGRTPDAWKLHWRRIHEEVCSKLREKQSRRLWKLAHYGRE